MAAIDLHTGEITSLVRNRHRSKEHGSWLNLIEMFFSKIARSFLRYIRVQSKEELVERIYQGIY